MRCADVLARSTAYLDGELAPELGSALRGHLRQCESCRDKLFVESQVRDQLRGLEPELDPPATMWKQIQARLAEHEVADAQRGSVWRFWTLAWRQAPLLGGALAAALALFWMWPATEQTAIVGPIEPAPEVVAARPGPPALEQAREFERTLVRRRFADARAEVARLRGVPLATDLGTVEQKTPLGGQFVLRDELASLARERRSLDGEMRALLDREAGQ